LLTDYAQSATAEEDDGRRPSVGGISEGMDQSLRISTRTFDRLARFVTAELGIKMPESKVSMIQSRLARRIRELDLGSIDDYCEYLFAAATAESQRVYFIDAVTTNKTDFFREPQHFKYLTGTALPQLVSAGALGLERRLSVWSAGC